MSITKNGCQIKVGLAVSLLIRFTEAVIIVDCYMSITKNGEAAGGPDRERPPLRRFCLCSCYFTSSKSTSVTVSSLPGPGLCGAPAPGLA